MFVLHGSTLEWPEVDSGLGKEGRRTGIRPVEKAAKPAPSVRESRPRQLGNRRKGNALSRELAVSPFIVSVSTNRHTKVGSAQAAHDGSDDCRYDGAFRTPSGCFAWSRGGF